MIRPRSLCAAHAPQLAINELIRLSSKELADRIYFPRLTRMRDAGTPSKVAGARVQPLFPGQSGRK